MDSLPCILISMASALEQTGLQDVEFTDDLFWSQEQDKNTKCDKNTYTSWISKVKSFSIGASSLSAGYSRELSDLGG